MSSFHVQPPAELAPPAESKIALETAAQLFLEKQRWRRAALACSVVGIVVSLAALLGAVLDTWFPKRGWMILAGQYDHERLHAEPVTYHPMVPDAALPLLILCGALFVVSWNRRSQASRLPVIVSALVVILWLVAKLIAFVDKTNILHIGSDVLRISPVATLSMMAGALALLLVAWNRSSRFLDIAAVLSICVAGVNLVVITSYLDGLPLFYGEFGKKADWPRAVGVVWSPVALTAAVGYLSLGFGLLYHLGWDFFLLRPKRARSARALIWRSLPVAFLVVIGYFIGRNYVDSSLFTHPNSRILPAYELCRALLTLALPITILWWIVRTAGGAIDRAQAAHHAMDQLALAKADAETANLAKGQFLANMSHELRTPLAIIKLQVEELQEQAEEENDEDLLTALQTIFDAAQRQGRLIDEILDLGKIEAGRLDLSMETVDLGRLVHNAAAAIRPLAAKKGNVLNVDIPEQAAWLRADPLRLRQCLDNLLNNACKFTENGTIRLQVQREVASDMEWIAIHVGDTGIGMVPEEKQKLFQAFVQARASTARKYGGTGLGLTITRNLCRLMGGEVTVASQKGVGSTFTMRFPAKTEGSGGELNLKDEVSNAELKPQTPEMSGADDRIKVLVIDDEPRVRELLARFLSREGFNVISAKNGEEGIRLARQLHPSAITLDVLMPGMDGWTALFAMKSDPEIADIPVIMLTIVEDKSQGYTLGASDYVTKPVDRQRLLSVLKKHCGVKAPAKVMLIEDDSKIRELLRRTLDNEGWSVAEAVDGRDALEQVARHPPDAILLDLLMPEMDGFEFIRLLRQEEKWRSIPVVVLTAKDLTAEERQRLNGNVTGILQKGSSSRDEVLRDVSRLLANLILPVCAS